MATLAYRRVSTTDQAHGRQLPAVVADQEFADTVSGAVSDRPGLSALLAYARPGDVVHVQSIDRLARSLQDLLAMLRTLSAQGVTVRFHTEALEVPPAGASPVSDLLLHVLGAVAQFERSLIRERQAAGITRAKAAGKYKGRPPCAQADAIRAMLEAGQTPTTVARTLGISRSTVYAHRVPPTE